MGCYVRKMTSKQKPQYASWVWMETAWPQPIGRAAWPQPIGGAAWPQPIGGAAWPQPIGGAAWPQPIEGEQHGLNL